MLKKASSQSEPIRLVLLADQSVWDAQLTAARKEVDRELGALDENDDFTSKMIAIVKATSSNHSELVQSLSVLQDGAKQILEEVLAGEDQKEEANRRISEAVQQEDTRAALAYVRAHGVCSEYRESSNMAALLDPSPEGATWVELKGLSRAEVKSAERSLPPRPSLGALLAGKALDVARKSARRSEDSTEAYARYISGLSHDERVQIQEYEDWSELLEVELFRRSVIKIDGFNLEEGEGGYPVEEFQKQCVESSEVITECSRHAKQVSLLCPKVEPLSSSQSGTPGSDSGGQV